MENSKSHDYNLNLGLVDWHPYYLLSKGSLGQIMVSFSKIKSTNPKNIYERSLYQKLNIIIKGLVDRYDEMLQCNSEEEKNVKFHNLIVNLPRGISIYNDIHGNIKLGYAKIGQLIYATYQRIDYILERETPTIYENDALLLEEFNKMKNELSIFRAEFELFETSFVEYINEARQKQNNSNYNNRIGKTYYRHRVN